MIPAMLLGPGLRYGAIGVAALAVGAFGFKQGLDWRAGQLEAAHAKAQAAVVRAEKSEAELGQIQREVAAAMTAARDRALELEKSHEVARANAQSSYDKRIAGVLDQHKRLSDAISRRSAGPVGAVPGDQSACRSHDPALEQQFAGELQDADRDRARLAALQELVRSHDLAVEAR